MSSAMGPSDAELVVRVLDEDDRQAFAELVRRHQSMVRTLLRRLTGGDLALADDLAQETFLRAYRGLRGFHGGAKLSSWLYRIAYNVFLSQAGPLAREVPEPAALTREPGPTGEATAEQALLRHDLERAMAGLGLKERAALALAYAGDLSHEEAAQILGCPLGTLKTYIHRARTKLRQSMASWDDGAAGTLDRTAMRGR